MQYLKILFVLQSPFCDTLGMSKVHYDLKIAYEKLGHTVDVLAFDDLYPKGQGVFSKVFGPLFSVKIFKKLKEIANNYDVIDANFDCIPYSKESFNFKGLLVYRSHGLQPLYRTFEKKSPFKEIILENSKSKKIKFKTRIGNIYRALQKKTGEKELYDCIKYADIVHCLNQDEYQFLLDRGIAKDKMVIIPNGISDSFILKADKTNSKNKSNIISFVASWTLRKGINELNSILNYIKEFDADIEELKLLGGVEEKSKIESYFNSENQDLINIIPTYKPDELFHFLKDAKIGIFPSYIEGLPLSIVEQLSFGIPVVAYAVPGPTDILSKLDSTLLIEPGNTKMLSIKVSEILNMSDEAYLELSNRCKNRAKDYLLSNVASIFIDLYKEKLRVLSQLV